MFLLQGHTERSRRWILSSLKPSDDLIPGIELRRKTDVDYVLNRITQPGEVITIENPVTGAMRRLGLVGAKSNTKFVPDDYLFNSPDVRLAVLQGLFDSDGGPVTQHGRTCRIQYTTVSDRLRDHVVFLVQSLGGVVYRPNQAGTGPETRTRRGREVHHRSDAHILDIRLPEGVTPFRLDSQGCEVRHHRRWPSDAFHRSH